MPTLGLTILALFVLFAVGSGCAAPEPPAMIVDFTPASGTYYPEDTVVSSVEVENVGAERRTFWVGYSVRDGAREWRDAPSAPLTLDPGERSGTIERGWEVPADSLLTTGPYRVKMAVWTRRTSPLPETGGSGSRARRRHSTEARSGPKACTGTAPIAPG